LTASEITAIRALANDMPPSQALVRLLLERVLVEVVNGTEQVKVTCHWHGGHRTSHPMVRPIARLDRLSRYDELVARTTEPHRAGHASG